MNISKLSKLIGQSDYIDKCGMNGFYLQRRLYSLAKYEADADGNIPITRILENFVESWDEQPLEILASYIAIHGEGKTLSTFTRQDADAYEVLYEKVTAAYREYVREIADAIDAALQTILDRGESLGDGD